ncbi:MAG: trehalose-phosphatase [Janthinobacterium lividum]
MLPLSSLTGVQRLQAVMQPGVLCVFDFDGTLAPIVSQPDAAGLPELVRQHLQRLQRFAPVAILTGRSLADIRQRAGFNADYLIGNHGMEGLPGWENRAREFEAVCRDWHAQIGSVMSDPLRFEPGLQLEDKRFSLSMHYRHVHNTQLAQTRLLELFDTLVPPARIIGGKFVYNLLPRGAVDKGWALQELMRLSGAASVVYVGDDVTDEDVFRLTRPDLLTIRVGHADTSAAQFFVDSYDDITGLLDMLIAPLADAQAAGAGAAPRSQRPSLAGTIHAAAGAGNGIDTTTDNNDNGNDGGLQNMGTSRADSHAGPASTLQNVPTETLKEG